MLYERTAFNLATRAAGQALERDGLPLTEIGMVIFVSTTGLATPSLDSKLIRCLGLSPHTAWLPVWGLGCAGGRGCAGPEILGEHSTLFENSADVMG